MQAAGCGWKFGERYFRAPPRSFGLLFPRGHGCAVVLHKTDDIEARAILPFKCEEHVEIQVTRSRCGEGLCSLVIEQPGILQTCVWTRY